MDLVNACGLQVAANAVRLHQRRSDARHRRRCRYVLAGPSPRLIADLAPRNAGAARKRDDDCNAQIDAWHLANPAKPLDIDAYAEFLRGIGYLQPEPADFSVAHGERRSGDRQHRRAAARRSRDQCTLRAECRERPLGQPVRRAVRHRRDPRGWRRDARSAATTASAAPASSPRRAQFLDQAAPLADRQSPRRDALCNRRRAAIGHAEGQRSHRSLTAGAVRRLPRRGRPAISDPAEAQWPARRDRHRSHASDRATGWRRALPTSCWKRRSPRSRTARTRSPASMPRTRSRPTATGSA